MEVAKAKDARASGVMVNGATCSFLVLPLQINDMSVWRDGYNTWRSLKG